MRPLKHKTSLALCAAAMALATSAQPTGQWDFNDLTAGLRATVGSDLTYQGGAEPLTTFNNTTGFGIPNIAGTVANVARIGVYEAGAGLSMPTPAAANGGGSYVNDYTLLMDVLFPAESHSKVRAILESDLGLINPDSEFFVNADNGIGVKGQSYGSINTNSWYRIAFVVDADDDSSFSGVIRAYIDGNEVGRRTVSNLKDDRFALIPGGTALLFSDDTAETAVAYVNSVQLRDAALTPGEVRALGAASAAGLPQVIPPVPSGIVRFIPGSAFASRTTPVGAVIDAGSTTIQDSSISLRMNGTAIANPSITRDGTLITVQSAAQNLIAGNKYTNVISFTESLAGAKSFTNVFTAALFYEDFNNIELGPNIEESSAGEKVWTNQPPAGWGINNTNMLGYGTPDEDGDGRPDADGRSEWFGWAFADVSWWPTVDNQRRSEFTLATGAAAIADPDEWDDGNNNPEPFAFPPGLFNSLLTTPSISLSGIAAGTAFLRFDSSWRPEAEDDPAAKFSQGPNGPTNNQTAVISVWYDGGPEVQVLKWDSRDGSPTFHPDAPNESVQIPLNNPAGAQNMKISFALLYAANDWWWAVDNIAVSAGAAPPVVTSAPTGVETLEGSLAALTVGVAGEGLTYQWYKGQGSAKALVTGATAATLSFPSAALEQSGYYSVAVSNSVGGTVTSPVRVTILPRTTNRIVLMREDFNALPLGPSVDEALTREGVWTKTGPTGWTIDDTGVPGVGTDQDGVTEWAGWSFADRAWWAQAGGDQQRSLFTKGTGAAAIADSDEWDDVAHAAGNMETILKTATISLQNVKTNSVILQFDSSWRPESPQKAVVSVSFDGGAPIEILRYDSEQANPNYRPDEVNETIALRVPNPQGAQNMQFIFRYYDTRNNWWWAIDNIVVLGDRRPLFFEDFNALVLGSNVDETLAGSAVWTSTPPSGWSVDNTTTPGLNDPAVGVREWEGWNFADRAWWAQTAGNQRRVEFVKGTGAIAVADGDEWDDKGSPASLGKMNTFMTTRPIDISGAPASSLSLRFDSSWRDEPDQKVNIRVSYNGAAPVEVLRWESVAGAANFHDDAPNETVVVPLNNPAGATSMVITFGYFDAGNNWWWAIDNVEVFQGEAQSPALQVSAISREGNNIRLSWTGGTAPFLVERKATLTDANWSQAATVTTNSATIPIEGNTGFFRARSGQ